MNMVVSREEWRAARMALLEQEKALTRARDALNAARVALPWVKVEKPYRFHTERGPETLADLFRGRGQLLVQHFMFGPDWTEGCVGCSLWADHVSAALPHLAAKDVTFVAVSRAPLETLLAFRQRMGWAFDWVSSLDSDFNRDFGVTFTAEDMAAGAEYNWRPVQETGELPGNSSFYRDAGGAVFHTYSAYGRGAEEIASTYMLLDIAPLGRNESGPQPMAWVRHHDRYAESQAGSCCCT
jgi:predicted dithiol-disulfide oxidoreductase (DUF899 family)